MSVLFRCRIEKSLLEKADKVTGQLGTSTAEMFRIFVAQIARTGKVPLKLETQPDDLLDRKRRNRVLRSLDDSQVGEV
jgi:antitoxin component of RelBE/YafQ-DinJ toxin-antitoxin module